MMRDRLVPLLDAHFAAFDGPFVWGQRDCVIFAAEWVRIVTGRQLVPEGLAWTNAEEAATAMRSLGCADTAALATRFLEPRALTYARLGDIVWRHFPPLGALGICIGADARFIHIGGGGLVDFPVSRCEACWSVA